MRIAGVSEAGNAWRIEASFEALYPGHAGTQPILIHLIIDVDQGTGVPRVVAQG